LLNLQHEPDFAAIRVEDIKPAMQTAMAEARAQIAAIKRQPENAANWLNTVEPLTDLTERVGRIWGVVAHLNSVVDTPELRAVYNELMPEVTVFFTEIGQDIELYARFKAIKQSPEFAQLSPAQQTKLAHDLRERAAAWQGASENADTPLAGVPFLLKDLLADWEGAPTWSGSRMMQHYIAKQNSDLTQAYLDAGLRVFGKTTTPYATAKLVQPGNTEAIGIHNHHEGCVRYVHTHFNNSGAHQNIYFSAFKRGHYSSFFLGVHTPMQACNPGSSQRRILF